MVLMAVGEHDAAHLVTVLQQVRNVGYHDIDAQKLRFREHQAGVDDKNIVSPADGHAVHSELAQTAQGHNVKFSRWHVQSRMLSD